VNQPANESAESRQYAFSLTSSEGTGKDIEDSGAGSHGKQSFLRGIRTITSSLRSLA